MKNEKITPLYKRLSRDDELQGESMSIQHQKQMLEEYTRQNHLTNPIHFTDDGISGTRFDRPGFTAMMEEVEAGRVEAIVVKDMIRSSVKAKGMSGKDTASQAPCQISQLLAQQKIEIPAVHLARHGAGLHKTKTFKDPFGWGASTAVSILKKREYLGRTVNFKTRKHFKDKKGHYVDESEWTVLKTPTRPLSTKKPLTTCSESGPTSGATRTASEKSTH